MLDSHGRVFRLVLFVGMCLAGARNAGAACNQPPDPAAQLTAAYEGDSGTISSPFLIPGKLAGENNTTKRTTRIGARTGSTYGPVTGDVLTVAIRSSSPQVAAVFASDCTAFAGCAGGVTCHKINSLSFATSPASVTFETSDVLDQLTRTGPVRLAVTPMASVPCTLATTACPATASPTMHACIDDVTLGGGTDYTIESVTALPEPNEFWKLCKGTGNSECSKVKDDVRYTIDLRGDMLVPFDWSKLLKKQGAPCKEGDSCDLRKVRASTNLDSGLSTSPVIQIPCAQSGTYLQSFSAAGTAFTSGPLFQAETGDATETRLVGSIDKAFSVLRIRRCPQADPQCTAPLFTLQLGSTDYLEIKVPAATTGTCSDGTDCSKTVPCSNGQKCTWFDAEDAGPLTSVPPVLCSLGGADTAQSGFWVIVVILIAGVLVVIWVFRKK